MNLPAKIAKNRAKIITFEQKLAQVEQIHIEPVHHFAHGIYAREALIPKGTLATGKIHKTVHLVIISQGDISVFTEEGLKRIKAPCTLVCQPGTKRAIYTHEDTVWTTIHGTHETDLEKIEQEFIAPSFDDPELLEYQKRLKESV